MHDQSNSSQLKTFQSATGPRTKSGKEHSSQNALTHGATSQKLLNEDEQRVYEAWAHDLSQAYPSTNPLVRIQIQRIAHLKVQLDRIQSSIAGLYEIERLSLEKYERAARVMNLSTQDRAGVMAIRHAKPLDNSQESPPADRVLPGYVAEL